MKKPERLSVRWTRRRGEGISALNGERGDVLYEWGSGCAKADGALLHYHFGIGRREVLTNDWGPSLLEDLHKRGYDLTTLKFSIRKRTAVLQPLRDESKESNNSVTDKGECS